MEQKYFLPLIRYTSPSRIALVSMRQTPWRLEVFSLA